jgi:hypothetical protein
MFIDPTVTHLTLKKDVRIRRDIRTGGRVPTGFRMIRTTHAVLGRYPMAVMIIGTMIAREPAFELRVAILAPHGIDLLHVRGIDSELDL